MVRKFHCSSLAGLRSFGKALILPQKTPEMILQIYRDSVSKMINDSLFLDESEKLNSGSPHVIGKSLTSVYAKGVSGDPEDINYMKTFLKEKYGVVFE